MLKQDISKKKIFKWDSSIVIVILYKIILDYSYVFFEHEHFAYEGFDYTFSSFEVFSLSVNFKTLKVFSGFGGNNFCL